jgi:hypothetical protein
MKFTLAALLATAAPLCAATLNTTVTADTYLRNDGTQQNTNSDGDTDNEILVGDNVGSIRGLLAFDVAPIVNAVNTTGGGDYANLVINSATLEIFERRGIARTINVTVNSYGFNFVATAATWNAPASGDPTPGGTIGAVLGSQTVAWNTGNDNESSVIALSSANMKSAIQGAPTAGRVNLLLNSTNTGGNTFLSITSDRSTNLARRTKLVIDYTVTPAGGPELTLDPTSPEPDFDFPFAATTAPPLTRTVRYKNTSSSFPITVEAITVSNTLGTAFTLGTVSSALPVTLAVGESIDISVSATGAATADFTGSIFIDTDVTEQDKTLPLGASFYLPGTVYGANASMSSSLASWGGASTFVTPGFITAGDGMARVRGIGDPVQPPVNSSHSQATATPGSLPDWELDFRFSPVAPASFASYAGQAADGQFTDRTFQLVVQSTDAVPAPALTSALDDHTLINLAYLPDGASTGGVAGFYLFDGGTDTWQLVDFNGDGSALVLAGSVDVDTDGNPLNGIGDGILDAASGDTVNAYRLSLRGQGFGSVGASYSIVLNGPGPGFPKTVSGLTVAHNQAIAAALPASFAFITADQSDESNAATGICPSFWVDEAAYFAVERPAQRLLAFNPPATVRSLNGASASHVLTLFNDGASADVDVSASITGTAAVSLSSPPSFPFAIAPGARLDLTLAFDPTLLSAPDTAATGAIGLTSNDPVLAVADFPYLATKVTDANLVANGDFESATGTGVFPVGWTLTGTPSAVAPFLVSGGGVNAVSLAPAQAILQDIAPTPAAAMENFQADFAFQIGNETQAHRIRLEGDNGADLVSLRLTTSPAGDDSIDAFDGTFTPALSGLTILPNTTYFIRVIGRDFGLGTRGYTVAFSTDGLTYTTSGPLDAFHFGSTGRFETVTFECGGTAGSSLLIDNVAVTLPADDDFATWISSFTFAPGADISAEGDADNDGISNVMENVFGTPPNAASAGVAGISGSAGSVGFQHPLNPSLAGDVSYSYQWSTDLAEWRASGVANTGGTVVTISPGAPVVGVVTVSAAVTTGAAGKLFTRIVATAAP